MFKIGTATAVGVGTVASSPAMALAEGSTRSLAIPTIDTATTPVAYTTASQVTALTGFGAGHILSDPALACAEALKLISVPTYEGSGVAVHPSVYFNQNAWNGFEYWMAFTPYPSANSQLENPSIVVSHDGNTWMVPNGLTNPIEPTPVGVGNYNSDGNITVGTDGLMYLFWRTVGVPLAGETWYYKTSTDGVTWSERFVLRQDAQSVRRLVSPSFSQLADGSWVAYAVDIIPRPYRVVRIRADNLSGLATAAPEAVTIAGNTVQPWHIDVHRVSGEWQMLVQDGGPGGGDLWAAVSADGLVFTAGGACVARNSGQWNSLYYKSCFVPAIKNGIAGWDTWLTGASFVDKGSILGRTFIGFAEGAAQSVQSLTPATPDTAAVGAALQLQLLEARLGIYPWIVGDTFARPDAANLGNTDSGQPWIADVGVMKLSNKGAGPTSKANTRAVVESATRDHWVSVRLDSAPSATSQHWLLARFQDSSNFYRLGFRPGGPLTLEKLVNGTLSGVRAVPGVIFSSPGKTIGLRCSGTTLEIYVDNNRVDIVADSALASGTKVGIQADDGTAVFRSFTARVS